jgi:hypothetical protein
MGYGRAGHIFFGSRSQAKSLGARQTKKLNLKILWVQSNLVFRAHIKEHIMFTHNYIIKTIF